MSNIFKSSLEKWLLKNQGKVALGGAAGSGIAAGVMLASGDGKKLNEKDRKRLKKKYGNKSDDKLIELYFKNNPHNKG